MGRQTTIDSYSAAVASGALDAWVPEERTARPAYPTHHRSGGRPSASDADAEPRPERFTTFGFVEYPPRE
ncbi:hypothetical protein [Halobaculum lipolyticum]|uniref:Uncharacterized protein n=1 Tax=Halobaculum lipolyticum TaxID=3032001 RepID=A0ABD5WE68_9EURY|nr:hypothetical protein [Halobaculum sp. DT31]